MHSERTGWDKYFKTNWKLILFLHFQVSKLKLPSNKVALIYFHSLARWYLIKSTFSVQSYWNKSSCQEVFLKMAALKIWNTTRLAWICKICLKLNKKCSTFNFTKMDYTNNIYQIIFEKFQKIFFKVSP